MTILANYPNNSQLTAKINGAFDCVPTSISDGIEYLTGQHVNIDAMVTACYGANYHGATSASRYVDYCAERGVRLFPVDGDNAALVADVHAQIQAGHPCLLTEPDPYAPAHPDWSHVLSVYGETPGALTARDPYSTRDVTHPDAVWAAILEFREIWVMEALMRTIDLSMPEVAAHFTQSGAGWLSKHTGKPIGGGILAFYQSYGNTALCGLTFLGLPLSGEKPIQGFAGYERLAGKGIVLQPFERGIVVYDPGHEYDAPPGAGPVYLAHLYSGAGVDPAVAQLQAQVAQLTKQLAAVQSAPDAPQEHAALLQMTEAGASALGKHLV